MRTAAPSQTWQSCRSERNLATAAPLAGEAHRDIQSWSPMLMPTHGPTWYSHWLHITSALMPEIWMPA